MMCNKTNEQVRREYEAYEQAIATLKNRQVTRQMLMAFQQQGATRPQWTWFVPGSA